MKKLKKLFIMSLFAVIVTACSEEYQSEVLVEESIDLSEYEETFTQNIKYNGMVYRVLCGISSGAIKI